MHIEAELGFASALGEFKLFSLGREPSRDKESMTRGTLDRVADEELIGQIVPDLGAIWLYGD